MKMAKLHKMERALISSFERNLESEMYAMMGLTTAQVEPRTAVTATEIRERLLEVNNRLDAIPFSTFNPLGGVPVIESPFMVDVHEDWSRVRSPARARRRRRKHRQNIVVTVTPSKQVLMTGGKIFCHPEIATVLRSKLEIMR